MQTRGGFDTEHDPLDSAAEVDVRALSQRRRIIEAMVQSCAEKTFAATKISDIVRLAAVSRTTFYQNFPDKRACFSAALSACVDEIRSTAIASYSPTDAPAESVRKATVAILDLLAANPTIAELSLREAITVDPAVVKRYRKLVLPALEAPWLAAGEPFKGSSDPRVAYGRLQILIFDQLALGRAKQLPEMLPEIVYVSLLPFAGHEEALRQARLAREGRGEQHDEGAGAR